MKAAKHVAIQGPNLKANAKGQLPDRIELCHAGEWKTPWHDDFILGDSDFYEAKGHFDSGHYRADNGEGSLPAGLDHFTGPAAYWIDSLDIAPSAKVPGVNSLWANITWTELGKEKVLRDEYRYTSMEYNHKAIPLENPEKAGEYWVNVLTGSTLTNDPLFKKLKPVMASARTGSDINNQGDSMNLEQVRAKKPDELTDEERKFLDDHKADLTEDERKNFGLEAQQGDGGAQQQAGSQQQGAQGDGTNNDNNAGAGNPPSGTGGVQASAQPGMTAISADRLERLEADAKAGRDAQLALQKAELRSGLQAHAKRGVIRPTQIDELTEILLASADGVRTRLQAFFSAMPTNPLLEAEVGSGKNGLEASVEVTKEEKELAGSFGNTPEEIEAFKKQQANN